MKPIALCVDSESCRNPILLGLEGEAIDNQNWLVLFHNAAKARNTISIEAFDQVWVVSCDDMEAINLAATLKRDNPSLSVCLVGPRSDGSLHSRAYTAGIDVVYDQMLFVRAYSAAKQSHAVHASGNDASSMTQQVVSPTVQLPANHKTAHPALLIPVVSGSGGSGKSIVSAMFALTCAQAGMKTLLIDYDLQFGDESHLLGWEDAPSLEEYQVGCERAASLLPRVGGISLLAAPRKLEDSERVVRMMPAMLDELCTSFDVIVANTGAAWAEQHAVLLERSSITLFLIDQRSTSIRACRHALELCERCSIATGPLRFVLNRCAKNSPFTSIDASCGLGGQRVLELKDGGFEIEECMAAGVVPELLLGRNELYVSIRHAVGALVGGAESLLDDVRSNDGQGKRGRSLLRRKRS